MKCLDLLISHFYDQGQLWKRKSVVFVFLFISITLLGQNRDMLFSEIVPDLTVLPSGFNYNTDNALMVRFNFYSDGNKATFVGRKITSKDLIEKLGTNLITDIKGNTRYQNALVALRVLEIFADTLELDTDLWIPQCNIKIKVESVILKSNNITIKSSPLPWLKVAKPEMVEDDHKGGRDGFNGGNIDIYADYINRAMNVDVSGSDGEPVKVPDIKISWPTCMPDRMEVYKCHNSDKQGSRSSNQEIGKGRNIIAMKWFNFSIGMFSTSECHSFQTWDREMYFDNDDLKDIKKDNRIVVGESIWGRGGNSGVLTTNLLLVNPIMNGGKSGYYLSKNQNDVKYKTDQFNRVINIDVEKREFHYSQIATDSDEFGKVTTREYAVRQTFTYPSNVEYGKFINKYRLSYGQEDGSSSTKKSITYLCQHQNKIAYDLDQMAIDVKSYHQLNETQQSSINKRLTNLQNYVDGFEKNATASWGVSNADKEKLVSNFRNQLQYIESHKGIDYDLYNNPLGYRPVLSFSTAMTLMDKNLDADLYLYIIGDSLYQQQVNGKMKMETLSDTESKLLSQSAKLDSLLLENHGEFGNIQAMSEACKRGLDSLQKNIKVEVEKLEEKAKKETQKRKIYAIGIKTIAVATSVIATAYGQPAIGAAAYSILNNVADGVEANANIGDIAKTTITKFDLKGVVQGYKDGKLMKIESDKRKDVISGYEKKINAADEILKPKYQDSISMAKKENRNAFLKNFIIEKEKMKEYAQYMKSMDVNIAYVNQQLDLLKNTSMELRKLTIQAQEQIEKQSKLFETLNENLSRKIDILNHMYQNGEAIYSIQEMRLNPDKIYQPDLYLLTRRMKEQALERLKWYEYELIKTYEFTTLKRYDNGTNRNYFDNLINAKKAAQPNTSAMEMVSHLKTQYLALTQDIKNALVKNIMPYNKQDIEGKGKGRRIALLQPMINELNDNGETIIDLQADFPGDIIKADQSNLRIISIELDESLLKFNQLLKSPSDRIDIKLTLDDKSIMRKEEKFYLFDDNSGKGNEQPRDIWTWTIQKVGLASKVTSSSEPSEYYKSIMNQILGIKSDNGFLFTMHPAWTKLKLEMQIHSSSDEDIILKGMALIIRCDYELNDLTKKGKAIMDMKINQCPPGTIVKANYGSVKDSNLTANLYKVLPLNSQVTLELIPPVSDAETTVATFDKWVVKGGKADTDIKNQKITVTLSNNTEIYPVFK